VVVRNGGAAFSMMNEFAIEWFTESSRWVDAVLKRAIDESDANKTQFRAWLSKWTARVESAILPLAQAAFDQDSEAMLTEVRDIQIARIKKVGLGE